MHLKKRNRSAHGRAVAIMNLLTNIRTLDRANESKLYAEQTQGEEDKDSVGKNELEIEIEIELTQIIET